MSGVKYRFRPVEKVIEELRTVDGGSIYFVDDYIIGIPKKRKSSSKHWRR